MAIPTTPYMSVLFDESLTPPGMLVTDLYDYGSTTIDPNDVEIYLQVVLTTASGDVIVYDNLNGTTADIARASTDTSAAIPLPLDGSGNVLLGSYKVTMQLVSLTSAFDTFSVDYTFVYTEENPDMKIQVTVNCADSTITAKDVTNYGSYDSISRLFKIYPPAVLGLPAYQNTLDTITVSGIYTQTWTAELTTTFTYTDDSGYTFTKTITAVREFEVDCDTNLCTILCCIDNIKKTYDRLINRNPTKAEIYKAEMIDPVMENLLWFYAAQQCGDVNKMARYKDAIVQLTDCSSDCGCTDEDDNPIQVIPTTAVDLITVVDSPDNSLDVTTTVAGNTTVYHVQVSSSIQNFLSNSYNTRVSTSTPSYIQIVQSGTNPKTFYVNFTGSIPTLPEEIEVQLTIATDPGADYAGLTRFTVKQNGTHWKSAGVHVYSLAGGISPNSATSLAKIDVSNLLNTGTFSALNAHVELVNTGQSGTFVTPYNVEIVNLSNSSTGSFTIRFVDKATGAQLLLGDIINRSNTTAVLSLSIYNG